MSVLLFIWESYDAHGGWNDFVGAFQTVDAAVACAEERMAEDAAYEKARIALGPAFAKGVDAEADAAWAALIANHSARFSRGGIDHVQIVQANVVVRSWWSGDAEWTDPLAQKEN